MFDPLPAPRQATTCRFRGIAGPTLHRVIGAVVDQNCSQTDVAVATLEALEVPLADLVRVVSEIGPVVECTVWTAGSSTLCLTLRTDEASIDDDLLGHRLGESESLVRSFFCLEVGAGGVVTAKADLS